MPASLEMLSPAGNWRELAKSLPGQRPKYVPQILPDGERKIYSFECDESDSFATVTSYKWPPMLRENELGLIHPDELEKISEHTVPRGESFQAFVKTGKKLKRVLVRVIQV